MMPWPLSLWIYCENLMKIKDFKGEEDRAAVINFQG